MAAGLISLGASAAVAVGTLGGPPPVPSMMSGSHMSMPGHNGAEMMGDATMMNGTSMMNRARE